MSLAEELERVYTTSAELQKLLHSARTRNDELLKQVKSDEERIALLVQEREDVILSRDHKIASLQEENTDLRDLVSQQNETIKMLCADKEVCLLGCLCINCAVCLILCCNCSCSIALCPVFQASYHISS